MAESESTKARRTKIETEELFWATVHTGTREMLIAAGQARPEQFPGEPGCGKTSTVFPAVGAERKKQVRRRSTYLYEVAIYKTRDEQAAWWAADNAKRQAQDASTALDDGSIKAALAAAQRERYERVIAEGGADALRKIAQERLQHGCWLIEAAFNLTEDPAIPYRFDEPVRRGVLEAIVGLIQLMRSPMAIQRAGLAAQNTGFQRFMRNVQASR